MLGLVKQSDYECQPSDYNPPRSLLVVVPTPPQKTDNEEFSSQVRRYNNRPPFSFSPPDWWTFKKVSLVMDQARGRCMWMGGGVRGLDREGWEERWST